MSIEGDSPYPGSREAQDAGCICPVIDNGHGNVAAARDRGGWWVDSDCPLHSVRPPVLPQNGLGVVLDDGGAQ